MNWDWNFFVLLNGWAGHSALLDAVGIFLAEDAFLLFGALLIALWVWPGSIDLRHTRQRYVINGVLALGGALLTAHFLGVFFYRARPFVDRAVTQLIAHPTRSLTHLWYTALNSGRAREGEGKHEPSFLGDRGYRRHRESDHAAVGGARSV